MKPAKMFVVVALFVLPMIAASVAFTQEDSSFQSREQNFREYITLLRADLKSDRKHVITQMMQFDADDASKFWPIFDQYDAELTKLGDRRIQLIVDYAKNYENLTDSEADALMTKAFDFEADRTLLKKKYFDKMKTSIGAIQSAKFFLVENQMQHIVDLQISAGLPTEPTAAQ